MEEKRCKRSLALQRMTKATSAGAVVAALFCGPASVAAPAIEEFVIPTTVTNLPWDVATGSDGAVWFTEKNSNKIGRITTTGNIKQ